MIEKDTSFADGMGLLSHPSLPKTSTNMSGPTLSTEPLGEPRRTFVEQEDDWIRSQQRVISELKYRDDSKRQYSQSMNADSSAIWSAAFSTENSIGSMLSARGTPDVPPIEGYNPYETREDGTTDIDGYEQFYEAFAHSRNPATTEYLKAKIDDEVKDRQILENGGVEGFIATLAAGLTDPINLAALAVPFAQGAGIQSFVRSGLVASSATELALQSGQETRTLEESALNITAGALFDGILGAAAQQVSTAQRTKIVREMINGPQAVGAAAVIQPTGAEIVKDGPIAKVAALMSRVSPLGRGLQSESETVRSTMQQLTESSIRLQGDAAPASVETLAKRDYAEMSVRTLEVRDIQSQFIKRTGLSELDFSQKIVHAMIRGDVADDVDVQKAVDKLRAAIDEQWERAAQAKVEGTFREVDGEIVPIRSETDASYITRRYDLNVIRNNPEGYKRAWMTAIADARVRDGKDAIDDVELYEIANKIYEDTVNLTTGDLHFNIGPSGAAQTKTRAQVSSTHLEAFMVKDWESLYEGYVKSLAPRTRMSEVFGDYRMTDQLEKITDEYSNAIGRLDRRIDKAEGAEKTKLTRERDRLTKKLESERRDLEIVRDRILNVPQEPNWMNPENRGVLSALRAARSWNIVTSLSNLLISSIPDMARLITYNGTTKFAKAFSRSAFTKQLRRSNLPKNQLATIASAMERANAYRLSNLTEVEDGVVYTRADKYAHKAADMVLTASGSKHWNSTMKTVAGYLYSDRIGRALRGTNAEDTAKLKQMGLDGDILTRARSQARKHAFDDDGLYNLNLERWTDREVVETIEAGAIKEADALVVTPGAGDKPIWFTGEVGRTLFQFKSFMLAATNRITLPLTQEGGLRPWKEITTATGLGLGVYAFKQAAAGREISDDPAILATEAIENTGLAGYAVEMAKMGSTLTGYTPLESEDNYQSHASLVGILGPTASMAERTLRIPDVNQTGESKAKAIRKLMPMQNHFLLRQGYDKMEEDLAKVLGGGEQPQF